VPSGLNNVIGIDAGLYNSIVFKKDGTAIAWGAGSQNYNTWPMYGQSIVPNIFTVAESTPPSIPFGLVATDVRSTGFTLSWEPSTDNVAVEGYEILLNDSSFATTASTTYTFDNLNQLTNYKVEVRAFDAANNKSSQSAPLTVKTGDGTPPSIPIGLVATNVTYTSFALSWSPSTDNVSVAGYQVFLNGDYHGTSTANNYNVTGLTKNSTYTVTVKSFDNLNNTSASSQSLLVTTPDEPPPDTQAPSAPGTLTASNIGATTLTLNWSESTDNVGVTGYDVYRGATLLGTVSGTTLTYQVIGLTTGTTYTFSIRAKDAAGNNSTARNITTTTNSAPTNISLTSDVIAEMNTSNAIVGTLSATDVDLDDTFTYALVNGTGSTDNSSFAIDGTSLKGLIVFDYESKASHSIRVRVTDQVGLSFEKVLTVKVANVNEAPTDIVLSNVTIVENSGPFATVGIVSTSDPDASSVFSYSLVNGTGSTDNDDFVFDGTTLRAKVSFDYETKSIYSVRMGVSDGSLSYEEVFIITVTDVNESPTNVTLSASSIAENNVANALVGTLTSSDPDTSNTFSYSLVSGTGANDNASFTISGANLTIKLVANYEAKASYSIRVRTTDNGGLSFERTFTIAVNDVNEAPNSLTLSNTAIMENNMVGAQIGTFGATDPDSSKTFSYFLVNGTGSTDNASFAIVGNSLNAGISFNFEVKKEYSIRSQVSDGSLTYTKSFIITVTNVNEPPVAAELSLEVTEDTPFNGSFKANDVDGDTLSYDIVTQPLNGTIILNQSTGGFSYVPNENATGADSFVYKAWDGTVSSNNVTVLVNVSDVNDAPNDIELSNSFIAENSGAGAIIGELSATDPDASLLFTYTLVDGAGDIDNDAFEISDSSLSANSDFDYETKNSYSIRIQVSDGALSYQEAFTIGVFDANEAPTDISLSNSSIAEGSEPGSMIGELSASDPDSGSMFTFSLVSGLGDNDNEYFDIDGTTLHNIEIPDYETKSAYKIRMQVSDGTLQYEESFIVSIQNVNEGPTDLLLSQLEIDENNNNDAIVGTLSAIHEDSSAELTYALVSGDGDDDNSQFHIHDEQLRASISFDYELKSEYSVRISVSDGVNSYEEIFVIKIIDSNDAPSSLVLFGNKVVENVWVDFEIGKMSATDPDISDLLTYTLVDGEGDADNANFRIEGSNLKAAIVFDFIEKPNHSIRVRATDTDGMYIEQSFGIEVIQSNALFNATNKVVTIYFQDTIFNAYNTLAQLKNAITITRNANENEPTYEALGLNDTVSIRGNRLVIEFENQVTGYYNRIKIASNALKDRLGFKSVEQISTPLVVDSTGPSLIKVKMDKKKKELTLQFSERVYMATTGANAKEIVDKFKAAVTFSRNGGAFAALGARDKISLSGRFLEITLATPLSTNDNKIRIAEDAMKDLIGNMSEEMITAEIDLDASGPILSKVTLGPDNKTITIMMNEEASGTTAGAKSVKLSALRSAISLSTNSSSAAPTYTPLTSLDFVELNKGVLTIKLATALTGANNKIKIAAGIMKDIFNNTNVELTTSTFAADKVGPTFVSTNLPLKKANRTLVITFNESINNGFIIGKTNENKAALKTAITIKKDDGVFVKLDSIDQVKVSGKTLQISFAMALVKDKEYQVMIAAAAIQDLTGNKSAQITTDTFIVDTTGPKLR
jgi:chitodextrinase